MSGHWEARNAADRFPTTARSQVDPERLYDPKRLGGAVTESAGEQWIELLGYVDELNMLTSQELSRASAEVTSALTAVEALATKLGIYGPRAGEWL